MAVCTAAQAIAAAEWWVGYKEKASVSYSTVRDKTAFTANAGSNNYSYPGYLCGVNGQAWCAAFVSTVMVDATGSKTDAKTVMHGIWPYVNVTQVYDAAPSTYKGRRSAWTPKAGDIIIFDYEQDNSRDHTGLVVAVSSTTITTIEGNSSNMVKKNTYSISYAGIWGYVRPLYSDAASGGTVAGTVKYGSDVSVALPTLSYGNYGPAVKTLQRILYAYYGSAIKVDGEFGTTTKSYLTRLQAHLGVTADGCCGANTWKAMLRELDT